MSGHSKWSTIKRQKGVTDIKRGQAFTKLANVITIAVKLGGSGDPDSNPRLRMAMDEARSVNMPKENIQRAIDRGLGKGEGQSLEEVLYEGFGPGKVAFMVEGVTDNRLRTTSEVKNIFDRSGGAMAGQGAVAFMFDYCGEIRLVSKGGIKDDELLELIDTGAKDVEELDEDGVNKYLVYTEMVDLAQVGERISQNGFKIESQSLIYRPITLTKITDKEVAQKVFDFVDRLEGLDDVQKVYANFDIDEELI